MKSIFRKLMSGLLLFSVAGLGGCSDDPDGINNELVLDRALTPLNFTAPPDFTQAEDQRVGAMLSTIVLMRRVGRRPAGDDSETGLRPVRQGSCVILQKHHVQTGQTHACQRD